MKKREYNYRAVVKRCEPENRGSKTFLLELKIKNFESEPGQFVIIKPLNNRSVMPRPFSVVDVMCDIVSFLIGVVGKNTKAYSELQPGDVIEIIGPQGSIIPIESKSYILVGGGIGGAALTLFAKKLAEQKKSFIVLLGARDEKQISGIDFFNKYGAQVLTITEKGDERTGLVTDLLEEIIAGDNGLSTIVACGPKPMLKKVAELSASFGNECFVILEEVMACSMGSCKGCAAIDKDGSVRHLCVDGPAIDAEWIDWPEFMPASVIEAIKSKPLKEDAMKVKLGDLWLDYPTMNAAGCLSIDVLENGLFDYSMLGALVTKGVTVLARPGNKMPRVCETPAGMINSIGLEGVGLQKFLQWELLRWLKLGKPVFVNISGFSIDDYIELARAMDKTGAVGVEVNISCPNIKHGGITFGINPILAYQVTEAVRLATDKLIIVKLTPNVTDIVSIAKAVVDGGADAISLINTIQAMVIDSMTRRPKIGTITGGLSGPAIRPVAVRMVHQLYQANLGVPIVGMGGIEDGSSAAEFIIAGADLVAVGTAGFSNRQVFNQIHDELEEIVRHHGFSSINELVGSMITS